MPSPTGRRGGEGGAAVVVADVEPDGRVGCAGWAGGLGGRVGGGGGGCCD